MLKDYFPEIFSPLRRLSVQFPVAGQLSRGWGCTDRPLVSHGRTTPAFIRTPSAFAASWGDCFAILFLRLPFHGIVAKPVRFHLAGGTCVKCLPVGKYSGRALPPLLYPLPACRRTAAGPFRVGPRLLRRRQIASTDVRKIQRIAAKYIAEESRKPDSIASVVNVTCSEWMSTDPPASAPSIPALLQIEQKRVMSCSPRAAKFSRDHVFVTNANTLAARFALPCGPQPAADRGLSRRGLAKSRASRHQVGSPGDQPALPRAGLLWGRWGEMARSVDTLGFARSLFSELHC